MTGFGRVSIGALALAILSASPGVAQTQDPHAGHHPADAPATAAPSPSPAPTTIPDGMEGGAPGIEGQQGKMGGQGAPMQGMPMQGGMMSADKPGCGMMGGGMMNGMKMSDHIDERLTAIRSELGITQTQSQLWDTYAIALRANAANMDRMHDEMMAGRSSAPQLSVIEQLDRHDRMLAGARDNSRAMRPALSRLYAGLSAEQKRKADTLLVPNGGMMQQMPMGNMKSGKMPMGDMKPGM